MDAKTQQALATGKLKFRYVRDLQPKQVYSLVRCEQQNNHVNWEVSWVNKHGALLSSKYPDSNVRRHFDSGNWVIVDERAIIEELVTGITTAQAKKAELDAELERLTTELMTCKGRLAEAESAVDKAIDKLIKYKQ